jgi:hypothetical protein
MSKRRRDGGLGSLQQLQISNFLAVVALCIIAFLLALNLILRFPDFGAVIEQYNQF